MHIDTAAGPTTSQLEDPDLVGQSAYRAAHQLLCEVEDSIRHDDPDVDDPTMADHLLTELDALDDATANIRRQLTDRTRIGR